jgi:hypothetical protein
MPSSMTHSSCVCLAADSAGSFDHANVCLLPPQVLRAALVDVHGQLVLLLHWSLLNCAALLKILKKHDKLCGGGPAATSSSPAAAPAPAAAAAAQPAAGSVSSVQQAGGSSSAAAAAAGSIALRGALQKVIMAQVGVSA